MQSPTEDQKQENASHLNDLNKYLAIRDYRQVLRVTNKLLHTDGFRLNEKLSKVKAVGLLKMERYEEVVKFADQSNNKDFTNCIAFEKAYALYKLFRNEEALRTLNSVTNVSEENQLKLNELKGQVLYRLDKFEEARIIYKNLIRDSSDDYDEDRQVNLLGCEAAISMERAASNNSEPLKVSKTSTTIPEAFFNKGIVHLNNGDLQKAEKSFSQGKLILEDEIDEEDAEQELGPYFVQLGNIKARRGLDKEALEIYHAVLKTTNDPILSAVANNNILAVHQFSSLFDSKKKVKALQTRSDNFLKKLRKSQLATMELNKAIIAYASGQVKNSLDIIEGLVASDFPKNFQLPIVHAACLAKLNRLPEATKILQDHLKSSSTEEVTTQLTLTLAQLNFKEADVTAFSQTSAFQALYLAKSDSRSEALESALSTFTSGDSRTNVLKLLGEELTKNDNKNNLERACSVYEELASKDESYLPKFIQVASIVNVAKAKEASSRLPMSDELIQGIDVEKLENDCAVSSKTKEKIIPGQAVKESPEVNEKIKKKRKRKPRLPKNMHPDGPDSERWLPLRDRSYYKGRRYKKTKQGGFSGAQGLSSDTRNMDKLDASKANFVNQNQTSNSSNANKKKKNKRRR